MKGIGPYVEFNSRKVRLRLQHSESGGGKEEDVSSSAQEDDRLHAEAAYQRAIPFLMRWKEELVSEHGYEDLPLLTDVNDVLFAVSNPTIYPSVHAPRGDQSRIFKLPKTAEGFASSSSSASWEHVFYSLHAERPNRVSTDFFIDEAPPLQNIFYLLQTMFDGMLELVREDVIDDCGDIDYTRVLPRKEWIQQNSDIVKAVLGLSSTLELEQDAENRGTHVTHYPYSYDDYRGSDDDLKCPY